MENFRATSFAESGLFVLLVKVNPFTVSELFTPSSERVFVTSGRFAGNVTLKGIAAFVPTSMEESTVKSGTFSLAIALVKVTELPLAVPVLQFERAPVKEPMVVVPLLIAVPVCPAAILANELATVKSVIAELAFSVKPATVIDSPAIRGLNAI